MKLLSIQVGQPKNFGQPDAIDLHDRPWTTAFHKEAVEGLVFVTPTNIAGDGQADLKNHGGQDKAICAYPKEHLHHWEGELGFRLPHGGFGENFTTQGLLEGDVCVGDIFQCGMTVLQISQPRQPCWKLARRWRIKDLAARVEQTGRTGWYFRVLTEGSIQAPADFLLIHRPHPEWTVAAANEVMHHRKTDWEAASVLASCEALSVSWRTSLSHRATTLMAAETALR
jgi:MOSC domain-containing protein YiiM